MSRIDTFQIGFPLSSLLIFALFGTACSQELPIEKSQSNSEQGQGTLQPATPFPGGTPVNPTPTPTPSPGAGPTPSPTPPSVASTCAAVSQATWMIQDTSYRVDFANSPEKRSYLCAGSLPQTAVGQTITASSINGNTGTLSFTCRNVDGTPTWQHNAAYNTTTGQPLNVSCGIYNSNYRPTTASRIDYRFHWSITPAAQNQMYGLNMIVRSYHPTYVDHLFSLDKVEGPNAGYILEGVGFNTVHLAATQDLGRDTTSTPPAGLRKVFRCYSPSRGKHYITNSTCELPTDVLEGSGGYLFTSANAAASGATLIPIYRCRSNVHDFATPSVEECDSVSGTRTILGYSLQ